MCVLFHFQFLWFVGKVGLIKHLIVWFDFALFFFFRERKWVRLGSEIWFLWCFCWHNSENVLMCLGVVFVPLKITIFYENTFETKRNRSFRYFVFFFLVSGGRNSNECDIYISQPVLHVQCQWYIICLFIFTSVTLSLLIDDTFRTFLVQKTVIEFTLPLTCFERIRRLHKNEIREFKM